jgi:hypothetical protein
VPLVKSRAKGFMHFFNINPPVKRFDLSLSANPLHRLLLAPSISLILGLVFLKNGIGDHFSNENDLHPY